MSKRYDRDGAGHENQASRGQGDEQAGEAGCGQLRAQGRVGEGHEPVNRTLEEEAAAATAEAPDEPAEQEAEQGAGTPGQRHRARDDSTGGAQAAKEGGAQPRRCAARAQPDSGVATSWAQRRCSDQAERKAVEVGSRGAAAEAGAVDGEAGAGANKGAAVIDWGRVGRCLRECSVVVAMHPDEVRRSTPLLRSVPLPVTPTHPHTHA